MTGITPEQISEYLGKNALILATVKGEHPDVNGHKLQDWPDADGGRPGHFYVIRGEDSNGRIKIADPANNATLSALWAPSTIREANIAGGYSDRLFAVEKL